MHILICNDDGYSAQGIKALTSVMERFGRVTVVAPEYNHSGASNSLTLNQPLTVTEIDERTFAVSGTPSDCIHVAMTGLLSEKPDLIVSGINGGANMGDDTLYSGTVADSSCLRLAPFQYCLCQTVFVVEHDFFHFLNRFVSL